MCALTVYALLMSQEELRQLRAALADALPRTADTDTQTDTDPEQIRTAELVTSLTARVASLQDEVDELRYSVEEASEEAEAAKVSRWVLVPTVRLGLTVLPGQEECAAHREAHRQLEGSVGLLQDNVHVSGMKLAAANYEVERLTAEWNSERQGAAALRRELQESRQEREELRMAVASLEQRIYEEGEQLAEARQDNKNLAGSLCAAQEEIARLQAELQSLQDGLRASGNNFEDIIDKARACSRLGDTGKGVALLVDEPDELAYTMEFERDETCPPGSAPVGVAGVRTIRSGRASANTSVASSDYDYQDDFSSPAKPGVTLPAIAAKRSDRGLEDAQEGGHRHNHKLSRDQGDGSSCDKPQSSRRHADSKTKGKKKRTAQPPCSECQKKYKGKGMRLPTSLHNAMVEEEPHRKRPAGEISDVLSVGESSRSWHSCIRI